MRQLLLIFLALIIFSTSAFSAEKSALTLSLSEAILLAIRTNPNVQSSKLTLVSNKFGLWVEEWRFLPHYGFSATGKLGRNYTLGQPAGTYNFNLQPSVSLLTPIGTELTLTSVNTKEGNYHPSLTLAVIQPLMRGFGKAVVQNALNNACDSLVVSRLNVKNVLQNTVTEVINGYLDVLSAEKKLSIDEGALSRAEHSVDQTKLFIKAGRKAGNELITVQANAASAKTDLEADRNRVLQTKYALLQAIGLDPNTAFKFSSLDLKALLTKYKLPTLETTKSLVLQNDFSYQEANILLNGSTSRALLIAEDNTRSKLNLVANVTTGGGTGGGQNAGLNSILNGVNQSQTIGLNLEIPIDDQVSKQAVLNAKIALKQAQLGFKQLKWRKETEAINSWNTVKSAERALQFAEDAEGLQEKTYNISYQKYLHGLIDSLELQSALVSLIRAQQTLLDAQINYLKALVTLDQLTGHTLKTWDIAVRV